MAGKAICAEVCLIFFLLCSAADLMAAPLPRHVLFLHSHTQEFPAHKLFENGFKEQLQVAGETNFEYSHDYLELTKFSYDPQYQGRMALFLEQKYALRPPDLVVTHLGPAADFMLKYGRQIFPQSKFMLATARRNRAWKVNDC